MSKLYVVKNKRRKRGFILIGVTVFFVWVCSQVLAAFSVDVRCETVTVSTIEDSVNTKGYILRKETLIEKETKPNCVVVANLRNGQRVSKGGTIATIYDNEEDALTNKKITQIDDELEKLEHINASKASFRHDDPDEISRQICNKIKSIASLVDTSKQDEITIEREKLLELLNIRQVTIGKIENFNERISLLKKDRETLVSSFKSKNHINVASPETGSFTDHIDGFENAFDFESATSMMPENLSSVKNKQSKNKDNFMGKIVHDLPWYICFKLDSAQAEKFDQNMSLEISIPLVTTFKLPVEVISVNKKNQSDKEVLVICSCDYMNEKLINIRENDIIVSIRSYTGIKVPKSALHEKKIKNKYSKDENVTGVYALKGNCVVFREVIPVYYDKDYIICKQSPDPESLVTDNAIKIYDQVVTEGSNLYDGKIVK